jgi:DNA-binding LacI/PurR family transcriptional regulator/DNA-binding transcriptional regulator YhcF (GntR family)
MAESQTITRMPVSEQIKRQLGRRLGDEWSAGERLPRLDELARMIGAGQRNTHRALRELVDEGFLVARPGVGTFVASDLKPDTVRARFGDQPRGRMLAAAQRLQGKRVALMVNAAAPSSPADDYAQHAQAELEALGAIVQPQTITQHVDHPLHLAADRPCDGALAVLVKVRGQVTFDPALAVSIVRVGEGLAIAMPGRYDVINPNGEQGGFLAGEHLRQLGHQRVAFIGRRSFDEPGAYHTISAIRLAGLELGLGAAVAHECRLLADRYDDRAAAKLVTQYMAIPDRPRAIFAASDDLALGFIVGASSHGLEVGRDFQIIGFDGQSRGRSIFGGPLTTIDVLRPQLARQAVRLLADRLHDPDLPVRCISHGCRLVPGHTTRPASPDNLGSET